MAGSVVGERLAGIKSLVYQIVVSAAVVLIVAGFHGVVKNAASAAATVFGRVVAGLNGRLLDSINTRLHLGSGPVVVPKRRILSLNTIGRFVGGRTIELDRVVERVV